MTADAAGRGSAIRLDHAGLAPDLVRRVQRFHRRFDATLLRDVLLALERACPTGLRKVPCIRPDVTGGPENLTREAELCLPQPTLGPRTLRRVLTREPVTVTGKSPAGSRCCPLTQECDLATAVYLFHYKRPRGNVRHAVRMIEAPAG